MRFLFLLIVSPFLLFSQAQYSLKIVGTDSNSAKNAKTMRYEDTFFDSLSIVKALKNISESRRIEGYLSANFDSIKIDSNHFIAFFTLGLKFEKGIINPGNIPQSALIYANMKPNKKGISILEFCKKRELVIEYFENNGYPFASIELDSINVFPNKINAVAKIIKSNLFIISSFKITGYTNISSSYILSQIGIKIGKPYDESVIKNIPKALNELSFVEIVSKPHIIFRDNSKVEIECELKKKMANRFDGIIGFAPNPSNNYKIQFTGKVSVELNNKLNKGEAINLDWQKLDALSQKLTAGYSIKYLFKTHLGSESNIVLFKQDTTFSNTDLFTAIPYYFTYNKLFKVFYENKTSTLLNKTVIENATALPDYADISKNSFGAGIKLWDLDYVFNPRKGYVFEFQSSSGNKTISKNPNANPLIYDGVKLNTKLIEFKGNIAFYIPITKRTIVLIDNKFALLQSSTIYKNELYKIGGTKSLRGFDENAIPCSRYTILSLEYRLLFQKTSNIFIFYNRAYYENNATINTIHDTPYGFGLGLNIQNKSNIFSISYAYGSQFHNPILFNAAKIHFGYLTVF